MLGPSGVPALLVTPETGGERSAPPPLVIWMHGRTAFKELDPGRYLRWMRTGIATCAVDLPGHGDRSDPSRQTSAKVLEIVLQMAAELDDVAAAAVEELDADPDRVAIGGMSAGGMAALNRLCRPHRFRSCSVEATTGDWNAQRGHHAASDPVLMANDPIAHLDHWHPIPLQAVHAREDEWVPFSDQKRFIERLRARYPDPTMIEFTALERTGADFEHIGFGRFSAEVKEAQRLFFSRTLEIPSAETMT